MRSILSLILIIVLVIVVSFAGVLGLSLLIGWLLTLILPFTLFEGSLLALIATIVIGVIAVNFFKGMPLPDLDSALDADDFDDYKEIPEERIYKSEADRTWENQYRLEMANQIYAEFQDEPEKVASMGEKQVQELALRLSEIAMAILKAKSPSPNMVRVTRSAFLKQMKKLNQQPYSNDILDLAMIGINDYILQNYDDLLQSIQSKDWKELAP